MQFLPVMYISEVVVTNLRISQMGIDLKKPVIRSFLCPLQSNESCGGRGVWQEHWYCKKTSKTTVVFPSFSIPPLSLLLQFPPIWFYIHFPLLVFTFLSFPPMLSLVSHIPFSTHPHFSTPSRSRAFLSQLLPLFSRFQLHLPSAPLFHSSTFPFRSFHPWMFCLFIIHLGASETPRPVDATVFMA